MHWLNVHALQAVWHVPHPVYKETALQGYCKLLYLVVGDQDSAGSHSLQDLSIHGMLCCCQANPIQLEAIDCSLADCCLSLLQSIISFGNSKLAPEAGDLLDGFCGQYVRNSELLIRHAGHRMSGQVLVEAVQGALPRGNAITVSPLPCFSIRSHGHIRLWGCCECRRLKALHAL